MVNMIIEAGKELINIHHKVQLKIVRAQRWIKFLGSRVHKIWIHKVYHLEAAVDQDKVLVVIKSNRNMEAVDNLKENSLALVLK